MFFSSITLLAAFYRCMSITRDLLSLLFRRIVKGFAIGITVSFRIRVEKKITILHR